MKKYKLVKTGLGKSFGDVELFESDDLETIERWILNNIIDENDESMKSTMYDLVHDLESFNTFLYATLTWEYLVIGKYQIINNRKEFEKMDLEFEKIKNEYSNERYNLIKKYTFQVDDVDDELEEFDKDIKKDYYSYYFDTHFSSVVSYFDELDDEYLTEYLGYYSGNGLYIDKNGKGLLLIQL